MDFGLFVEFAAPEGTTDRDTFSQGFALVDEAESMGGIQSGWPSITFRRSASCLRPLRWQRRWRPAPAR